MTTDVLGAPRQAGRGPALHHRRRATTSTTSSCRRWPTWPSCAARTPTPTSARSTRRAAKAMPGVARRLRRRRHPVQPAADGLAGRRQRGHPEQRQHAADPRHRQRQVDRRGRRRGRRRDAGAGARRARGDRRRLGAAAGRRRRREGDPARRAAAPRERPEQRRVRVDGRRQGRHRRRHRRRRGRRPPADRQPAAHPEPDGDPRRHRLVQPGHRRVHDLDVEPDAAHPAAAAGRLRDGHPGAQGPLHQPGRRRRLRHQDLLLRRHGPGHVRQQGASAAGRSSGSRAGARTTRARSTAATTSPTSRSPASATARSPASGSRRYANLGGRLSTIGPGIPTTLYARVLSGCYKIPNVYCRGHRRLHEHDVRRRLPRRRPAGGDLRRRAGDGPVRGRDRAWTAAEIRRRNFIAARPVPVREPVRPRAPPSGGAKIYIDSGNYEPALDKALAMAGYADLDGDEGRGARRAASSSASACRTYIEVCGVAPSKWIGAVGEGWGAAMWESSNIKVHLTGKVVVTMGTQPQGQGHETTYAQVVGHELGIPMEDIVVQHSDTQGTPFGYGSYGSRTSSVGMTRGDQGGRQDPREGAPVRGPHARGVASTTSRSTAPNYRVKGSPDKVKTIQEIAFALDLAFDPPEGMEPYLDETAYYDTPNCTWPFGTHIAIVEIDEETGARRPRPLRRGRRRRQEDQPDDRRRPAPRRHRPGRRPGALGGRRLQRRRPAPDRARCSTTRCRGRRGFPNFELDETVTPVAGQPARRQGRRRGRRDRQHGGGRQRRRRRAEPARHPAPRHAVHARRPCGGPSRPRREARHDPGSVRLPAPGDRSTRRSPRSRRRAARPRSSPAARACCRCSSCGWRSADTLIDIGRLAELKGARPTRRRRLRDRRADDLRRACIDGHARSTSRRECLSGIGDVQVRNRGTVGGAIAHADPASDLPALALALDYSVVAPLARAASGSSPLDGFFEGPFQTGDRSPTSSSSRSAAGRCRRAPAAPTGSSSSRRRATRSSASPPSSRRPAGAISHARVALTGVGDASVPGEGRRGGARSGATARRRRSRRPPRTRPTARPSTATSTPTATTGRRWPWSTPAARSRPRSAAGPPDRPGAPACASSGSPRVGARPRAWSGPSSPAT